MTAELDRLIADQARDARTNRVYSLSLDAYPSGADLVYRYSRKVASDPRHGTLNCYTNLRCRCDKCKAESARAKREQRARKRLQRGAYKDRYFCADCGSLHIKRERVYAREEAA